MPTIGSLSPQSNSNDLDTEISTVEISNSQEQATTETSLDSTSMVFFGDHQVHYTARRGPVQSRVFDRKIDVSLRPQALTMASPILQRQAMTLIEEEHATSYHYRT